MFLPLKVVCLKSIRVACPSGTPTSHRGGGVKTIPSNGSGPRVPAAGAWLGNRGCTSGAVGRGVAGWAQAWFNPSGKEAGTHSLFHPGSGNRSGAFSAFPAVFGKWGLIGGNFEKVLITVQYLFALTPHCRHAGKLKRVLRRRPVKTVAYVKRPAKYSPILKKIPHPASKKAVQKGNVCCSPAATPTTMGRCRLKDKSPKNVRQPFS